MKFKSKIDWWFHLVMLLCLSGCALPIVLGIKYPDAITILIGIPIVLSIVIIALPIYWGTYYTLEETALHVRCGFCINKRIAYKDIKLIYETRDPSASAGLSLDRISVIYYKSNGNTDEVLISPKNKQEFIRQLNERMEGSSVMSNHTESARSKKALKAAILLITSALVVIVAVAILITSLFQGTKTPPSYTFSNQTMTISGQFGRTINLSGAAVEYMSNGVPTTPIHTNGAGLGKIQRGMFSLGGTTVYKNIMDKNSPHYILITGKSGNRFYLNCGTPQQTEKLYNTIVSHEVQSS